MELAAAKQFADQFLSRYDQLCILLNNAVVMFCISFGLSKDNIETQFAKNHVAHFYFTSRLRSTIEKPTLSERVKLVIFFFTRELEAKGIKNVHVKCNHPRAVKTDLYRHFASFFERLASYFLNILLITHEDGALTQLYLSTSPEAPFGNPAKPHGVAVSDDAPQKLWEFTENLLKEKVPDYKGFPV
ncbi:MAG: hypothetical protein EXX96DRAFT_596034 [Benjaminiella poitrasii]|nr:MAG: hypothetical protein EXX96DRAFT_596034 [Benjaminiella poitrasii]